MNILHFEDNQADAQIFAALLSREWPGSRVTQVWQRTDFEAALQVQIYDLILCDHAIPSFDALSALVLARKYCPKTPFVFLSGTVGEERAIETLRGGVLDYVLKDSQSRLHLAIGSVFKHVEQEAAKRPAESAQEKSRERFEQIAENIDDFIALVDERGDCFHSNSSFHKLLKTDSDVPAPNVFKHVHPADDKRLRAFVRKALQHAGASSVKYRLLLPGGETRHIEARASATDPLGDESPTLLLVGRDVTDRKAAEERLHEQASLLDKARDGICVIDLRFAVTQWNASAERIFKRTSAEVLGRSFRELFFAGHCARFDSAYAATLAEQEWRGEFRFTERDESYLVVDTSWSLVNDASGKTKSILCIMTDVTSRRMLELELQRSQRVESLGMLAGGVAHDLYNILSPILLGVGLLRSETGARETQMILDMLQMSATHGCDLVQQILLFARGQEGQRTMVQTGQFLGGLKGFLNIVLSSTIELKIEHAPDLWSVSADGTQLKQVLLNLCVNARDAMPQGGCIRVSACNVELTVGAQRGFHGDIPPGPYVRLDVADTGTGIPPEVLERIFDPFFTTKELGKGTGLGLSTIAGIVQTHGGAIRVQSAMGKGTVFSIYLPVMPVLEEGPSQDAVIELPRGRGEAVLVIDDDDQTLLFYKTMLEAQGYEVIGALEGESGLQKFRQHRKRIQLVLCDQIMPGLNGSSVLSRIHKEAPKVKLIKMSGFGFPSDAPKADEAILFTKLLKPIEAETLFHTVRKAIDAPAGIPAIYM